MNTEGTMYSGIFFLRKLHNSETVGATVVSDDVSDQAPVAWVIFAH